LTPVGRFTFGMDRFFLGEFVQNVQAVQPLRSVQMVRDA
jgi:hypothetical protein